MRFLLLGLVTFALIGRAQSADATPTMKLLLIDGQNNHKWQETSPILKQILEGSGRFRVDMATSPPKGAKKEEMAKFRPDLSKYAAIVSNYNGEPWSEDFNADFVKYVKDGGGFVVVHAANNSFGNWPEYNLMIGLGGWGGRNEKSGPYIRYRDGKIVRDETAGRGGHHGPKHEFTVENIVKDHPITQGMPAKWLHTSDELYDSLRGPAEHMNVLAIAHSDKAKGGTGENEPMIWTLPYGKGRVFHTPMGHDTTSIMCVGFANVLLRGSEWAATGKVTIPVAKNFPTAEKTSPLEIK